VSPFYDLLCAGEENKSQRVGSKTLDAGDIIQTLAGWTVIGRGSSKLGGFKIGNTDFRQKNVETHKGIQAMDAAIADLSTKVQPKDAGRAMYLVSAPHKEIHLDLVKDIGDWLKDLAPNAVIRNGDYPVGNTLDVTLILSELSDMEIVRNYYTKSRDLLPIIKLRQEEVRIKLKGIDDAGKDIPTLF
jgi:hypothetical protein